MNKNLLSKMLLVSIFILIAIFSVNEARATVGGPTLLSNLRYNPADESVYFIENDHGGRGCPPMLLKISLNTFKTEYVFSCEDGEDLINVSNEIYSQYSLSEKIIEDTIRYFKPLSQMDLRDNNIEVDMVKGDEERFKDQNLIKFNEGDLIRTNFTASIYQNGKKVDEVSVSGCNEDHPFIIAGYIIPGFDKKMALLISSTKGDCFEGGYVEETLHIISGVSNLKEDSRLSVFGKTASPLTPNKGTLVVLESDTVEVDVLNTDEDSEEITDERFNSNKIQIILISLILGLILGTIIGFLVNKKSKDSKSLS